MFQKLKNLIEKLPEVHALVIGDVMLDKFMYGVVERISPEAPVPIFKSLSEKIALGGAGNVAANLSALNCSVHLMGVIGKDETGKTLMDQLDRLHIQHTFMQLPDFPTITKTRFIAKNNHLMRWDQEKFFTLSSEEEEKFLLKFTKLLPKFNVVLLSDYNKGLLTPTLTQKIIRQCNALNKFVLIDPKGNNYSKYHGATLIKPNLSELELITQTKLSLDKPDFILDVKKAASQMLDTISINHAIITLSEKGMLYVPHQPDIEPIYLKTFAQEVFDVSGAGDTSLSVLGAATAMGASIAEAMELANLAAGIVVGKIGTATLTPQELMVALQKRYQPTKPSLAVKKNVSLEKAIELVKKERNEGKVIGFTNGVFDLLHLGHLDSLRQLRAECDYLVVAVNKDISVKRYKGPNRPIQDEQTRAQILAALDCVDLVILFDQEGNDNTATPLVRLLKPDVIGKEGYTIDKWPEAQYVASYGGKVITLKRLEGYSSTNLVEKMKG